MVLALQCIRNFLFEIKKSKNPKIKRFNKFSYPLLWRHPAVIEQKARSMQMISNCSYFMIGSPQHDLLAGNERACAEMKRVHDWIIICCHQISGQAEDIPLIAARSSGVSISSTH
jgi:hypothetical protein